MKIHAAMKPLAFFLVSVSLGVSWGRQTAEPIRAEVIVCADQPGSTIDRNIYGHFAEHLGRCI